MQPSARHTSPTAVCIKAKSRNGYVRGVGETPDPNLIWANDHWRVRAAEPKAVPLVFLETREHVGGRAIL